MIGSMMIEVFLCLLVGSWMFCTALLLWEAVSVGVLGYDGVGKFGVAAALFVALLFVLALSTPYSSEVIDPYGVPEPYYVYDGPRDDKSLQELESALKGVEMPRSYERYVFDCSEMSSYVEWYLENRGFNASIIGGDRHARVLVYDVSGKSYVVGCTLTPPRVMGYDTDFTYDSEWPDIYAACAWNDWEWNWWKGLD